MDVYSHYFLIENFHRIILDVSDVLKSKRCANDQRSVIVKIINLYIIDDTKYKIFLINLGFLVKKICHFRS